MATEPVRVGITLVKRATKANGVPLYAVTINGTYHKTEKLRTRVGAEWLAQTTATMPGTSAIYIGEH